MNTLETMRLNAIKKIDLTGCTYPTYPHEVIKTMRPQVINTKDAIRAHFKRRHTNGNKAVRNWIGALRDLYNGSAYMRALAMVEKEKLHVAV